jgi:hypothetical protein
MKNILYIAPYKDGTGYSIAAQENMIALSRAGANVIARSCKMTPTSGFVYPEILEWENKSIKDIDCVVQHNLPHAWSYTKECRNVGLFCYETNNIFNPAWENHIQMVDKVITSCNDNRKAVLPINENVDAIPFPVNLDRFNDKRIDTIDFGLPKNCTIFYTIGELVPRKNYYAMIMSYLSAFSKADNVALIIKSTLPNKNHSETKKTFHDMIIGIKKSLNRFSREDMYPPIILISRPISDWELLSLHKTGSVFVSTSFGESFCLPFLDALYMGNKFIVPDSGAFVDFRRNLDVHNGSYIRTKLSKCFGYEGSFLYNSEEYWGKPALEDIEHALYTEHETHQKDRSKVSGFDERIKQHYSYEVVGNQLLRAIST